MRQAFQQEARNAVTSMGWTALFKTFDTDGSGSLEVQEFVDAVRSTGITEDTISSMEIRQIFRHVDVDRSGEVDGGEFAAWLIEMEEMNARDVSSGGKISGWQVVIADFVDKCDARVTQMGWTAIFKKHDDDGNGQLDQQEFIRAVRAECPKLDIQDSELAEMFGIIDGDGGGSISGEEFYDGLAMESDETNNMTFDVFSHSMLELADYWALEHSGEGYIQFLRAVFRAITERNPATIPKRARTINGHPKDDIPVIQTINEAVLLDELNSLTTKALQQRAGALGIDDDLIAAAMEPTVEDIKAALIDVIVSNEMNGGYHPNYMLRALDDIQPLVTGGSFIDPYASLSLEDTKPSRRATIMIDTSKRVQKQTNMLKDSRKPLRVGRIQAQIGTFASFERQQMAQTKSSVSGMILPLSAKSMESRHSTGVEQRKAFFATDQGRWFFAYATAENRAPVWAHRRAGTDAADCSFPSWLCRPTRALHGYLVYLNNNQAALAIQRVFRGWFARITLQRLEEKRDYFDMVRRKEAEAARRIQAHYRGYAQRCSMSMMKKSAIRIQTVVRDKAGEAPAVAIANLRSRYAQLGDQGMLDVPTLSQLLTEIGVPPHVVTGAQKLLSIGTEASALYSFDDACALLAAVAHTHTSQDQVLSERQHTQQETAIREALRTSCVLNAHELGDVSDKQMEEDELTRLLQLLHKPAELRSDKELEYLDRRWACVYPWFQELASQTRRELCRYLRGGLLTAPEPIYLVDEPLTAVFFVARGRVQLRRGNEIVACRGQQSLRTLGPGEEFGLPSSAASAADSVDWLGHERRTEVAEAEKGTILLALGIEQWAWTYAERTACERAMISRLLRSTALFANVSIAAHAALAAAMQRSPLQFQDGEVLLKQGTGRPNRLCLLTSGQVKMSAAVRNQVLDRGGSGVPGVGGVAAAEMKIDVGIFNARGEITGETILLEPQDPEKKWKAEASLVA